VVIPEALKQRLLRYEHQRVLTWQSGSRRIYEALRRYIYWPAVAEDIYKHVKQCPACAKNRLS